MNSSANYMGRNPFPGIRSFDMEEYDLFFGREEQVKELSNMLMANRLIVVTGASGSGKSSLVKAGLIPSTLQYRLDLEANDWSVTRMRPSIDPLKSLASAMFSFAGLRDYQSLAGWTASYIESTLRASENGLLQLFRQLDQTDKRKHLLMIDQFEEVFRYVRADNVQAHSNNIEYFMQLLLTVAQASEQEVYIIVTMQSDYLDQCAHYPEFTAAINKASYLVPQMRTQQINDAILKPIQANKAQISEALMLRIAADMAQGEGELLPIMQHAMLRTWDYWQRAGGMAVGPIDVSHYEAVGTIFNAIGKHANEIYEGLANASEKLIAEKIFKSLVDASNDGRLSRRPTTLREISIIANAREEHVVEVVETFRHPSCGFLMPSVNTVLTPDTTIDIAHESIIQAWNRLNVWLKEEVQSAQLYLRLSGTARMYQEGKSGLWVNPELELGLRWMEQQRPNLTWALRYDEGFERAVEFLNFSKAEFDKKVTEREEQQKRALLRARRSAMVLGAASVISLVFLMISLNLRFQAEVAEKIAREKETEAVWQRNQAEKQRKEAVLQTKISEQQQQIAEQQRIIAEEQKTFAVSQQRYAQEQQKVAEQQKHLAELKKIEAEKERQKAIQASQEAEKQKVEAEKQRSFADVKRVEADEERQKSVRLRMLALSRAVATQAPKSGGAATPQLPSQLALFAWQLNGQYEGHDKDADIFAALSDLGDKKPSFRGHKDAVRHVAYHPSKKSTFISAGDDGSIRIWNAEDPAAHEHYMMGKHGKGGIRSLDFNEAGTKTLAGTFAGELLVWGDPNMMPLAFGGESKSPIFSTFFLPNGKVVAGSADGALRIWDLSGSAPVASPLAPATSRVTACAKVPQQNLVVYANTQGEIWMVGDGMMPMLLHQFNGHFIYSIAVSQSGSQIAVGLEDSRIYLFDKSAPQQGQWLIGHISATTCLQFNEAQQTLASASYDGTIRIWDLNNLKLRPIAIKAHDGWVYHIAYAPSGKEIISGGQDRAVRKVMADASAIAEKLCAGLEEKEIPAESWDKFIGADIPKKPLCK